MASNVTRDEGKKRLIDNYSVKYGRQVSKEEVIDVDEASDISEPIYEEVNARPTLRVTQTQGGSDKSELTHGSDEGYADSQTIGYDNNAFVKDEFEGHAEVDGNIHLDDIQPVKLELPDLPEDELAVLKKYLAEPRVSVVKPWDVFRLVNHDNEENTESKCMQICYKITKVIISGLLFLVVLAGAMCAKGTLLFIASHVRQDINFVCNIDNDTSVNYCFRKPVLNSANASSDDLYNAISFFWEVLPDFPGIPWEDWIKQEPEVVGEGVRFNVPGRQLVPGVNDTVFVEVHLCEEVTMRWAWALLITMATPEVLAWLRCFWRICFKRTKRPSVSTVGFVLLIETVNEIGMSLFAFAVLPKMNVVRALVVMLGVSVIPGLLRIFNRPAGERRRPMLLAFDIIAAVAQISLVIIWPLSINFQGTREKIHDMWPITVSLILLSLGWWENFIDKNTNLGSFGRFLLKMKKRIASARTKTYMFVFIYKVGLKLAFMVLWLWLLQGYHPDRLFNFSTNGAFCQDIHEGGTDIGLNDYGDINFDWVFTWVVQFLTAFIAYLTARIACQIKLQIIGFSVPLLLSTLGTFGLLIGACESWNNNPFVFSSIIPGYLFWNCYPKGELGDVAVADNIWIIPVWWISELVITRHIWFPKAERMAKTGKLFIKGFYSGVIFEESLSLNRRLDDTEFKKDTKAKDYGLDGDEFQVDYYNLSQAGDAADPFDTRKGESPMIYIAATMWHENENEMCQLLKSIFRLDIDQSARRNAQQFLEIVDPDYYEFEAHVFFDDAFDAHGFDDQDYKANDFVKQLVNSMDHSASAVHKVNMRIPAPTKIDTPYGGRLEWRLPGGNKFIAHLKDKVKIRHKKRWSQVMYMYYFLGHRLWAQTDDAKRKQKIADNTFVLALDGDVDFQPKAVQLLVDLMKKNDKVGAACGRIHPIGSGPMVWYQKFEYAIGHWFQKATEHMIGCVLCSPGCFSLFRGSALMDDNVMKRYTTISTEPSHYVQYDQGEDRWLCTLLLQQGWRVEYCAASDSWTFAPEGFNEFYNQRRRWTPSTMANILDLLTDWKNTINRNENISMLYIIYQGALMMSTILGPGTIFLMIMGALQTAFGMYGLNMWGAFACNIVPVGLFILICYVCKTDTQLLIAGILSAVYAVVQMLVVVGLALSIKEEGFCSPSAIFLFAVIGFFIIAALVHPQEFFCIVPGALYFLLIPSMYLFLIIYSMCNMHVVSWGTREVKSAAVPKPQQEKPKEEPKNKFLDLLNVEALKKKEEGFDCTLGSCFKCLCCPRPTDNNEGQQYIALMKRLDDLEAMIKEDKRDDGYRERKISEASLQRAMQNILPNIQEVEDEVSDNSTNSDDKSITSDPEEQEEPIKEEEIGWIKDPDLNDGPISNLEEVEQEFWRGMILQYLFPLESNKEHQKQIADGLLELRNKMTFAFFIINALFVVVIFVLQLQKETGDLIVRWPCFQDDKDWIEVEPIGFVFLVFFGLIMIIQFLGMLAHRLGTLWHIIATTAIGCTKKSQSNLIQENVEGAIELAKRLQSLKGVDDDDRRSSVASSIAPTEDGENEYVTVKRKKHITKLAKTKNRLQRTKTLNDAFAHRFLALGNQIEAQNPDTLQKKLFKDAKGPTRGKSIKAFNKLQQNANYIFNEQKMEFMQKRVSQKKLKRVADPETISLTPVELHSSSKIRFASSETINEAVEEGIRRRSQSALVTARRTSLGSDSAPPAPRIRKISVVDIKPFDEKEEKDEAPPVGPRIKEPRSSNVSAGSVGTISSITRERAESNISTIKTLIEMTEKTSVNIDDDGQLATQRL